MAKKITELPDLPTPASTDIIPLVDISGSITSRTTVAAVASQIPSATVVPAMITNPYKFRAYSNTTQNSGNGAFAQVLFNTENYDSNSNFASSTYTAPVAGFYMFGARIHTTSNPTRLIVSIYKNGSEAARGADLSDDDGQLAGSGATVTTMLQLAANDTITAQSFGNTTLTLAGGSAECYFWGVLISVT